MKDKWLRILTPLILATLLYSLYVVVSNFASPENFSFYFLALDILSLYIYFEVSRSVIRSVDYKLPQLSMGWKIPLQFLMALIISMIPGLLLYALTKYLFIIYAPQNDSITVYHLYTRAIGVTVHTILAFSINLAVKYLRESKRKTIANESLKREQITNQFEILKSQVDPHFLFNSLNTLHTLIKNRSDQSEEFLISLSDILRHSLNDTNLEIIPLSKELKILERYIFIQKKRFGSPLSLEVKLRKGETDQIFILPFTLMVLVENAIKHNRIDEKHHMSLSICTDNKFLTVTNNIHRKQVTSGFGSGLQNLKERYKYFTVEPVVINAGNDSFSVKIPSLYVK